MGTLHTEDAASSGAHGGHEAKGALEDGPCMWASSCRVWGPREFKHLQWGPRSCPALPCVYRRGPDASSPQQQPTVWCSRRGRLAAQCMCHWSFRVCCDGVAAAALGTESVPTSSSSFRV